jgi:hypothetical protein
MVFKDSTIKFEKTEDCIVGCCKQDDYQTGMLYSFLNNPEYKLYHMKSDLENKQIYFVMTRIR